MSHFKCSAQEGKWFLCTPLKPGKPTPFSHWFWSILSITLESFGWVITSSPNNKSSRRKGPTSSVVEIWFGLVLNFVGSIWGLTFSINNMGTKGSPGGSDSKESACNVGDPASIPVSGRSPGEGNRYLLSTILAWRIPWTEEPGGLQSMGPQRVRQDWATSTFMGTKTDSQFWEKLVHLHCWAMCHCANESAVMYPFSLPIWAFGILPRFLLFRTAQLWMFPVSWSTCPSFSWF